MLHAWYYVDGPEDPKEPHRDPHAANITQQQLETETGVSYMQLECSSAECMAVIERVRLERGYNYMDTVTISPNAMKDYSTKMEQFFEEHLHADEEVRFIVDGSGYFDVRDSSDRWVRVAVARGSFLVLPAGIYHRFTCDTNDYIKACRLFSGEPVWKPHARCLVTDKMAVRQTYIADLKNLVK